MVDIVYSDGQPLRTSLFFSKHCPGKECSKRKNSEEIVLVRTSSYRL